MLKHRLILTGIAIAALLASCGESGGTGSNAIPNESPTPSSSATTDPVVAADARALSAADDKREGDLKAVFASVCNGSLNSDQFRACRASIGNAYQSYLTSIAAMNFSAAVLPDAQSLVNDTGKVKIAETSLDPSCQLDPMISAMYKADNVVRKDLGLVEYGPYTFTPIACPTNAPSPHSGIVETQKPSCSFTSSRDQWYCTGNFDQGFGNEWWCSYTSDLAEWSCNGNIGADNAQWSCGTDFAHDQWNCSGMLELYSASWTCSYTSSTAKWNCGGQPSVDYFALMPWI